MDINQILRFEEVAALAYFIPDYRKNPELSLIDFEIEAKTSCEIPIEADCKSCARPSLHERCTQGIIGAFPAADEDDESSLDRVLEELKDMNVDILRGIGLSEATVRYILNLKVKPSRIRITRQSGIILDDYDGLEIRLDDKTKALYFLFLRHPEGIAIKDLPDHVNEVMDLYQSISGRDDPEAMRKTVVNLCDPFQNNANISLSRIKKAFCEAFSQSIASKYYVDGDRGGLRSISLSRDLVIWETIR